MNECEKLAWFAGLADGEGSFYVVLEKRIRNKAGFRLQTVFEVANTNMTLLNECLSIAGCGKILLTHKSRGLHEKTGYVVHFNREQLINVIPRLLPYLIGKKRQAEIILEMARRMYGKNIRYTQEEWNLLIGLYNECRSLNKRGQIPYVPISPGEIRPAQYVTRGRCSIEQCNGLHYGHGLCRKHWRNDVRRKTRAKRVVDLKVISAA